MNLPKINLVYYKNILDLALAKFFDECNDSFSKIGEYYVLSKQFTKTSLKACLEKHIAHEL